MKTWFVSLGLILMAQLSWGQYCTPTGNCSRGDYIDNFTFYTISNIGSAGSNCGTFQNPGNAYSNVNMGATIVQGTRVALSVRGRQNGGGQGFGIWIDYNQDTDFDDPGEFVSASLNSSNQTFTDSVTIPLTAKTGTTKMRVRSLRNSVITSTQSCATFNRGETEDYTITITQAPIPPVTAFSANTTFSCNGTIQFIDQSINATSWVWEFGNGDTSHRQNPLYTYGVSGTYTVKLTTSNNFGTTPLTKTNYITVTIGGGPATANCTPTIGNSAAGFGITSFSFSNLSGNSQDATAGYEDYSCNRAAVTQGNSYRLRFGSLTSPANQNFRAWIDYNGDGIFTSQEMVLSQDNRTEADDIITIPATSNTNSPLRIRVAAVYFLNSPSNFTACSNLQNGQMEDYHVYITPNTIPPLADFEADPQKSCSGEVQFNDLSSNVPTSWVWDFGDGNRSILQNPKHTYTADGTYTIKLSVTNSFGQDSTTKTSYVTIDQASAAAAACTPTSTTHIDDYGVHYVIFNTINNITQDGREGYQDYSCTHQTTVQENNSYNLEVKTGTLNKEDVKVWIDYNNDGTFASNELIMNSTNNNLHSTSVTIPAASTKFKSLRMRVMSDIIGTNYGACSTLTYGQTEDYAVIVQGDTTSNPVPVAQFTADSTQSCTGVIQFTDQSSNIPSQWAWDFGDGNTSNIKNPRHTYTSPGRYTVKLVATNSFGNGTETKTNYIDVDDIYCTVIGIPEIKSEEIAIYPNPSQGKLFIEFPDRDVKKYDLSVLSLQGQVLYLNSMNVAENKLTELNFTPPSPGTYLIRLQNEDFQIVKRVSFN